MKMQQDISQEEKLFRKEAANILSEIKTQMPFALKDGSVRFEHKLNTLVGDNLLAISIETDMPEYVEEVGKWWQLVRKLEERGAFTITQEDDFGCCVKVNEQRFNELLAEYDRPLLLKRCFLELNLQKATLRYRRGKPVGIDTSSQPMKLLTLLLRNGEASYSDIKRELRQDRDPREMQYIKRDLRKILLSAGVRKSEIKNIMAPKKNWGYVMRCDEKKPDHT